MISIIHRCNHTGRRSGQSEGYEGEGQERVARGGAGRVPTTGTRFVRECAWAASDQVIGDRSVFDSRDTSEPELVSIYEDPFDTSCRSR